MAVKQREILYPDIVKDLVDQKSKTDIAKRLNITRATLYAWMETPEFQGLWDQVMSDSTADLQTSRETARLAIQDMLPEAIKEMKALLKGALTKDTTRWRVIQSVFDFAELRGTKADSASELREYLKTGNVQIVNMGQQIVVKASLDQSFIEALGAVTPNEIIEGQVRVLDPMPQDDNPDILLPDMPP